MSALQTTESTNHRATEEYTEPYFCIYDKGRDGMATTVLHSEGTPKVMQKGKSLSYLKTTIRTLRKSQGLKDVPFYWKKDVAADPSWQDYSNPGETARNNLQKKVETFPINERFGMVTQVVDMMAKGIHSAAVITGQGGTGKSHTVFEALDNTGIEYVKVSGHVALSGLYEILYHNRGKDGFVVFDDTDSIFANETTVNWLKAVLDTTLKRTVSWESTYPENTLNLPRSFDFDGRVLFISNRIMDRIPQAIRSRSMVLSLDMTPDEIVDRMRHIAPLMREFNNMRAGMITETIDYLDDVKFQLKDVSLRTLIKALRFRQSGAENWQKLIRFAT